jgi:hypothetical protein
MKYIIGCTPCPRCRGPIYPSEDLFTVQESEAAAAPLWEAGVYHYQCFLGNLFRGAYLKTARDRWRDYVARQGRVWKTLGQDEDFALVFKPLAQEHSVYFFRQGREFTFDSAPDLCRFLVAVVMHDGQPAQSRAGGVRWLPARVGWLLGVREEVPVPVELPTAGHAGLLQELAAHDPPPPRRAVPVGAACARLGLTPDTGGYPLDRITGVVRQTEARGDVTVVTVGVEKWVEVLLTVAEAARFKRFMQGVSPAVLLETRSRPFP